MAESIEFHFSTQKPPNFFVSDLRLRAYRVSGAVEDGKISFETARKSLALHVPVIVPGFGQVWLAANNEGKGYSPRGQSLLLVQELVRSRMAFVRRRADVLGIGENAAALADAEGLLEAAEKEEGGQKEGAFLKALERLLVLGENIEIDAARRALADEDSRQRVRPVISATFFGERKGKWAIGVGPDWQVEEEPPDFARTREQQELLASVIDGTTVPNFWRWIEPVRGKPRWDALEKYLDFAEEHGIKCKSFALVWPNDMGGTPVWFRTLPFSEKLKAIEKWVAEMVTRYRGRISAWETANELHDSTGNFFHWNHKEIVKVLRMVNELVSSLDPGTPRIINHNMALGDYIQRDDWQWSAEPPEKRWVPLTFLDELIAEEVPFDGIGLQQYVPLMDVASCFAWLDEFARLAKPIWITEIGYPSGYPENSIPGDGWRGTWSEETQAGWVESFYTLALSRPYIRALNYWDISDEQAFVEHAGLIEGTRQKPSFKALSELCERYRVGAFSERK